MGWLEKKSILITGATGGIGSALARRLANEGALLALNSRDEQALRRLAEELQNHGTEVLVAPGDISQEVDVQRVFKVLISRYGRLDILIHCAAIAQRLAPVVDISVSEFDEITQINVRGTFLCAREAAKYMLQQDFIDGFKGQIILFSSYMGIVGSSSVSAYCASKHAVMGLARAISKELLPKGIRVTAVCPREVDTPMRRKVVGPSADSSRWMSAQDVAEQVVFFITRPFWSGYEEIIIGVPQNL